VNTAVAYLIEMHSVVSDMKHADSHAFPIMRSFNMLRAWQSG